MKKYIFLLLVLAGCGSRKSSVQKEHTETALQTTSQETVTAKQQLTANVATTASYNAAVTETETGFKVKPVNPDKPAAYTSPDGKMHQLDNAELDYTNTQKQTQSNTQATQVAETSASSERQSNKNSDTSLKQKTDNKAKTTDRKQSSWWWLKWLIIAAIIIFIWLRIKKRRGLK